MKRLREKELKEAVKMGVGIGVTEAVKERESDSRAS